MNIELWANILQDDEGKHLARAAIRYYKVAGKKERRKLRKENPQLESEFDKIDRKKNGKETK